METFFLKFNVILSKLVLRHAYSNPIYPNKFQALQPLHYHEAEL